ncbi:hypothetical protein LB565_19245 [Mesorhizobium sp. CA14]|uniref:hypothetical protein n=1 Tax=Mesorhizobium sp. CA14 TaxID=2876642 RepID=UPI001CCD7A88|nr:hypothetical protein [Mesorhizobium sp. CA14]MBZ9850123.1 hypothetical protein [Mesorhizobium sp. CA14]
MTLFKMFRIFTRKSSQPDQHGGPIVFKRADRVKRVIVRTDPKRYETVYGTVIDHVGRTIKVRFDDGTEYHGADYPFEAIDRKMHFPEPIAYQNPDPNDWGWARINEWSTKPWKVKRQNGHG